MQKPDLHIHAHIHQPTPLSPPVHVLFRDTLLTHPIKDEVDGDGRAVGVVPPPDPLVAAVAHPVDVQPEVLPAHLPVEQLAQSPGQTAARHAAVVRQVRQVDVGAARVTLSHVVGDDAT